MKRKRKLSWLSTKKEEVIRDRYFLISDWGEANNPFLYMDLLMESKKT